MFTLTYETIEGRNMGPKLRAIVTDVSSKHYPIVMWVGEVYSKDASNVKFLKSRAQKALKEAQK